MQRSVIAVTRQRAAIHDLAFGATARAMRKYYTGKGASIYTWTSDQHAQYGTRVIQTTEREATYVLDAIFDNETDLDITIEEHTTDTAGYTDLVFGLFDLYGLKFSPRIRDIADQRLWRLPTTPTGTLAASLLRHDIRPQRFLDRWDDLLRGSATIRHGHNPASLLVARLQASARQNDLTKAIQEYGRVIKTISLVRYLHDEKHRRRILVQLNKGESLHALRRRIFFASLGQFQRRRPDDQDLQAQCLTLLTNAVVCWNTVYIAAALAHLAEIGEPVQNDVARRIVPNGCEHINFLGRYDFNAPTSPAGANSVHSDTETDAICPFADPTPCSTSSDCLRRRGTSSPGPGFHRGIHPARVLAPQLDDIQQFSLAERGLVHRVVQVRILEPSELGRLWSVAGLQIDVEHVGVLAVDPGLVHELVGHATQIVDLRCSEDTFEAQVAGL